MFAKRFKSFTLLLLTAIVLIQTVGVLHRVAHAHSSNGSVSINETAMADFTRLWGEHSSLAECQLFDQAVSDFLQTANFLPVSLILTFVWIKAQSQERFSLFERFYAARGPPLFKLI